MFNFLIGLLSGFFLAIPVGAIAVLCINKTLQYGPKSGLAIGTGAALADAFYAFIAIYSLSAISNIFLENQQILRIIGGLCLIFISTRMIIAGSLKIEQKDVVYQKISKDVLSAFFITLSNPVTYIGFIAVLSYIHVLFRNFDDRLVLHFSLGALAGSMLWWVLLVEFAKFLVTKVNYIFIKRSNLIFGIIILAFGVIIILTSNMDLNLWKL